MKKLNFDRFTKAKSLSAPEIEKKSLNFDATSTKADWYVLFGDDFVLVVKDEGLTNNG